MRYNIFNRAHLPLKTALLTSCISLSEMTSRVDYSLAEISEIVKKVMDTYNEQLSYEAFHVMPLIFEYEPSIASNYITEHTKITRAAKSLEQLLYQSKQKNKQTHDLLETVIKSYNEFVLLNYNHMDEEEAVLNEILWRYYGDPILKQTEEKMDILPHLVNKFLEKTGLQIANAA